MAIPVRPIVGIQVIQKSEIKGKSGRFSASIQVEDSQLTGVTLEISRPDQQAPLMVDGLSESELVALINLLQGSLLQARKIASTSIPVDAQRDAFVRAWHDFRPEPDSTSQPRGEA